LTSTFCLYDLARSLREQRIAMIQTLSQYLFFAKAAVYLFEKHLHKTKSQSKPVNQQQQQQQQSDAQTTNCKRRWSFNFSLFSF
jgi:hypothetical protein